MDLLRGFAILAVIAIHVSINFNVITSLNGLVLALTPIDVFVHFAVPLFILISGFVLSLKYYGRFSILRFYKKRALSVIPQYLAFSLIYLAAKAVLSGPMTLSAIVFSILTASSAYHLWFFAIIVELYLLYPLLIRVYRHFESRGRTATLLYYALMLQIAWNVAYSLLGTFAADSSTLNLLAERVFLSQIFFFFLGIHAARNFDRIKAYMRDVGPWYTACGAALLTAAISLTWLVDFSSAGAYDLFSYRTLALNIVPRFIEPILYVTAFVLCFKATLFLMDNRSMLTAAMRSLGKYSFGIYLIHILFLTALIKALAMVNIGPADWTFYPLLFAGTLTLSYISIYLLSFLPASSLLVGSHNKIKKRGPIHASIGKIVEKSDFIR